MKQNAAILALLVGAVAAQTRKDKDAPGPIYKAEKQDEICTVDGNTTVADAAAKRNASKEKVAKLKGELETAVGAIKTEREKRDNAVAEVVAKDKTFKDALAAADKAENDAMTKYKAYALAKKAFDDADTLMKNSAKTTKVSAEKYDAADKDKTAADAAVADAIKHKEAEVADEAMKKKIYGGVVDVNVDTETDNDLKCGTYVNAASATVDSKCKTAKAALALYTQAKELLDPAVAAWKEKNDIQIAKNALHVAAKEVSDEYTKLKTALTADIGATVADGLRATAAAADKALLDYVTVDHADNKIFGANKEFAAKAALVGAAWASVDKANTDKDYSVNAAADKTCLQVGDGAVVKDTDFKEQAAEVNTAQLCQAECQKLPYFDYSSTGTANNAARAIKDDVKYCYGYGMIGAKCNIFKKTLIKASGVDGQGCYPRKASALAKAAYTDGSTDNDFWTAVEAYLESTLTTNWNTKIDAALLAKKNLELKQRTQLYITGTLLDDTTTETVGDETLPKGLQKITDKRNEDLTAANTALTVTNGDLKDKADKLGMVESSVLADPVGKTAYGGKKYSEVVSAKDDTEKARADAKTAWQSALTEMTVMTETDKVNAAWAAAAKITFDAAKLEYKGDGGDNKGLEAEDKAIIEDQGKKDEAQKLAKTAYDDHLKLQTEYKDEVKKAEAAADGSGIAEQDAVAKARTAATEANKLVTTALSDEDKKRKELAAEVIECAKLELKLQEALETCESTQYAKFRKTFQDATTTRGENLETIKKLMDKREKAAGQLKPGSGKPGSRCERPRSNGDRKTRKTCEEGNCCGAATKLIGQTQVTIETCQKDGSEKYTYQPPRGAMDLAMPKTESWDFLCIEGANRVLAAAAAAAAAGLMMQ